MRHDPTVLEEVLRGVPWDAFDRLVERYDADARSRSFKSRAHLVVLLASALGNFHGLRRTAAGLAAGSGPLRLIGVEAPAHSTLGDANRYRPADLFADLFQAMLPLTRRRRLRQELREAIRLIDATRLDLGGRLHDWLDFRHDRAAKLHLVFDPRAGQPVRFALTSARTNDITVAKAMPIEPGATYVFDLGYYDYGWWAKLDGAGCRFVTRLKRNTPLRDPAERPVETPALAAGVLADRTGRLPERLSSQRHNPFDKPGREIVLRLDTGKTLRLFTNDLKSPAQALAALYKERWQIELFFKWVKQNLEIDHFMGTSENAVRCQIATALIAFLLVRMAEDRLPQAHPASIVLLVIRGNLFTRKPLQHLLDPPPKTTPTPSPQLRLNLCKPHAGH